jgi:hypothetical protein
MMVWSGEAERHVRYRRSLGQLGRRGLSRELLSQMQDAGPLDGQQIADQILDAGPDLIDALSRAQARADVQRWLNQHHD